MVSEPYDQDQEKYDEAGYESYRLWFLREYTARDPMLIPASFDRWVAFNKAMDTSEPDPT